MGRFILTADWHLRDSKPRCRLDEDWIETQRLCIEAIVNSTNEYECDLICAGDIFDIPNVSNSLMIMLIKELDKIKEHFYFIAGNHDLPYHSIDNLNRSSIGLLKIIACDIMDQFQYMDFGGVINGNKNSDILFLHELSFRTRKEIPPNSKAKCAKDLLEQYPDAKWIFIGDNHGKYIYELNDRYVISPGCINRQASDFKDYAPSIYFIDTDKEEITEIAIMDVSNTVVDDSYIKTEEERENRIEAFIEGVKNNGKVSLDFVSNLQSAIAKNKSMSKDTINMIQQLLEE